MNEMAKRSRWESRGWMCGGPTNSSRRACFPFCEQDTGEIGDRKIPPFLKGSKIPPVPLQSSKKTVYIYILHHQARTPTEPKPSRHTILTQTGLSSPVSQSPSTSATTVLARCALPTVSVRLASPPVPVPVVSVVLAAAPPPAPASLRNSAAPRA